MLLAITWLCSRPPRFWAEAVRYGGVIGVRYGSLAALTLAVSLDGFTAGLPELGRDNRDGGCSIPAGCSGRPDGAQPHTLGKTADLKSRSALRRSEPDQPAKAYLTVIARDPEGVERALHPVPS